MRRLFTALTLVTFAASGQAQAEDWEYSAALYGWFPDSRIDLDTPLGEIESELSVSDALDSLEMAFMGAFAAQKGRWGVLIDVIYFNLGEAVTSPRSALISEANLDSNITIVNSYATYEILNQGATRIDLGFGGRFYWIDNDVSVTGVGGVERRLDADDNWVDPIMAVRYRGQFADKWFGTALVDYGGFGVGSESTWQALATIGYEVNDHFSIQAGYRYLESERDEDNGEIGIQMSGPILGMTYRF